MLPPQTERIARQKRRDHQTRLAKDDHEQDGVGPDAVVVDDVGQVFIEVEEDIGEPGEPVHDWFAVDLRENSAGGFMGGAMPMLAWA